MAQFTILGETGSGKTCYLVGMYSEMAAGIGGYSIIAKNDEDDLKLQDMYDRMYDSSLGADRFPAALACGPQLWPWRCHTGHDNQA